MRFRFCTASWVFHFRQKYVDDFLLMVVPKTTASFVRLLLIFLPLTWHYKKGLREKKRLILASPNWIYNKTCNDVEEEKPNLNLFLCPNIKRVLKIFFLSIL